MLKITTKTGDKGSTSLFGGRRVGKNSLFIELVGELDELQSFLGWCKCGGGRSNERGFAGGHDFADLIDRLQGDVYRIMSIAGFEMKCLGNIQAINEEDVKFLEKEAEKYSAMIAKQMKFIKPGSTEMAARLHIARCVCRRVERRCVACESEVGGTAACDAAVGGAAKSAGGAPEVFGFILKYLNRLSDLLFVLAYSFEKKIKNC